MKICQEDNTTYDIISNVPYNIIEFILEVAMAKLCDNLLTAEANYRIRLAKISNL